jgi:amidophosphoribosyltransferase
MCGFVSLFLKNPALQSQLGAHVETMMIGMSERGPDSAGIAVYHSPVAAGRSKLTLFNADEAYPWRQLAGDLGAALKVETDVSQKGNHALLVAEAGEDTVIDWLRANRRDVRIMGYGTLMEVYKDMGLPGEVAKRYGLKKMSGSHAIGHTRLATESAVTTEHSHPFTPAPDMCLVHNGSLSNHNNLRKWLRKQGQSFDTDNDSEVAARYFAHRLGEGGFERRFCNSEHHHPQAPVPGGPPGPGSLYHIARSFFTCRSPQPRHAHGLCFAGGNDRCQQNHRRCRLARRQRR